MQQDAGVGQRFGGNVLAAEHPGDFPDAVGPFQGTDVRLDAGGAGFLVDQIMGGALAGHLRQVRDGDHLHVFAHPGEIGSLSGEKTLPYMYTNGLPFPELPEKIEIGTPLRFVYVGGDEKWRKGLDVLTEALRGFTPEQLTFDMIGIGPDSWVADFARANALEGVIRPLGKMQSDEIAPKLARDYDVLVLSSRHDGWGMTVSEAVLSGIGALVTDKCASRDVVEASGAGRVMTAGSVESTRAAIRLCVDSPETALAWKEKARAYRDDLRPEKLAGYLEETVVG